MLVSVYKQKVSYITQSDKCYKKNYVIWGVGIHLLYFNQYSLHTNFFPVKYTLQSTGVVCGKLFEWFYKISSESDPSYNTILMHKKPDKAVAS